MNNKKKINKQKSVIQNTHARKNRKSSPITKKRNTLASNTSPLTFHPFPHHYNKNNINNPTIIHITTNLIDSCFATVTRRRNRVRLAAAAVLTVLLTFSLSSSSSSTSCFVAAAAARVVRRRGDFIVAFYK
jgi:hypothetical protein